MKKIISLGNFHMYLPLYFVFICLFIIFVLDPPTDDPSYNFTSPKKTTSPFI